MRSKQYKVETMGRGVGFLLNIECKPGARAYKAQYGTSTPISRAEAARIMWQMHRDRRLIRV